MNGTLVYGDVYGAADRHRLNSRTRVEIALDAACRAGGATVMRTIAHEFTPQGITAVAILAESHAAVHTYPETGSYMVDVFTCGEQANPMAIAMRIVKALGGTADLNLVRRGDHARRSTDEAQ